MCREVEESRSRALEVQAELQALHADHARLSEQFDCAQTCNASLRHDLKACKRSLKQVHRSGLHIMTKQALPASRYKQHRAYSRQCMIVMLHG